MVGAVIQQDPKTSELRVDAGVDGVTIEFQETLSIWTPSEARRLAATLIECAAHVEARHHGRGIIIR